jgi:Flp pilus assembly protein protease CpaA
MGRAFVFSLSIYIAVVDIQQHRIHNRNLFIFGIFLIISRNSISLVDSLLLVLAVLLICLIFKFGGGDFKLLALLILTQGELIASAQFLSYLFFALLISVALWAALQRNFRGAMPLAPSILLPFLALYLDM